MRAIVFDRFGGPEVLHLAEIEQPEAGPGQLLIRVAYAGVNPADWKARQGWLAQFFEYRFPFVLGFDATGVVAAVGAGVQGIAAGDRVVAASNQGLGERGSYAEYVVADASRTARLPDATPLDRAAMLPIAGMTALQSLFDVGRLKSGQSVLVNGGAGGTGSFAICLAKAAGARVATTCSPANAAYVTALGADVAIDYGQGNVAAAVRGWAPDGLDLIVDAVGQGSLVDAVDWVKPGGTIAAIVTLIADETPHDAQRAGARGVAVVPVIATFDRQGEQLRQLADACANGVFDGVALTVMPLAEAGQAHQLVQAGHVRGKIVLDIHASL